METNGSVKVEMELVERGETKKQAEMLAASNETVEEAEFSSIPIEGLDARDFHPESVLDVPHSGRSSVETRTSEHAQAFSRGTTKKDSGLRNKRGGKALKIHVSSPEEEAERRRSHYAASVAVNAPLYPLDLRGEAVESSFDENSDRSSSFSPEVAGEGFGSPIELLPSRENFDELSRGHEQDGYSGQARRIVPSPTDEIPLNGIFHPAISEQNDDDFDDEFTQVGAPKQPWETSFAKYLTKTAILILLWYTLSSLLTYYNKELLGKRFHFPAPILMNTIHFTMQAVVSAIIVRCIPSMRPSVQMSWRNYFMRVFPTAIATALDIHLTNESLRFITVTFETMCKSSAPVFLLIFAFLFKLEVPSLKLMGIILIISAGVFLTVKGAVDFQLEGFMLVMSAAVMSGFRWTVTQLLLQKEEYGLNNPFATMSVLTPIMAAVSLFLSIFFDSWKDLGKSTYFDSLAHAVSSTALMLLGGTLAFFMVSTEFVLLSVTSAVTLTVAGIVKEVVTILGAIILFKDRFTLSKGVGLVVIIFGVSLYNMYKYKKLQEGEINHHRYVALEETRPVFELGDEIDEGKF